MLDSFNSEQVKAIAKMLGEAIPQPAPKIVDLRFLVDLIFTRFYVVLLVGKDRRRHERRYIPTGVTRLGNAIAAIILLVGANLLLSASFILLAYLLKALIGIDVFDGNHHLPGMLKEFWQQQ